MPLLNENPGLVDGLGQPLLVNLRLETSFQQLLSSQLKHVIELEFIIGKETIPGHPTEQGGTLKDPFWVLGVQSQQSTSSLSKLGQSILDTPNFTLAAKTILSYQSEFRIQTFLLEGTTRSLECLTVCENDKETTISKRARLSIRTNSQREEQVMKETIATNRIIT